MKRFIFILCITNINYSLISTERECTVILTPQWCDLDGHCKKATQFDEKWMLVGSIIFKKKVKEPIYLDLLKLQWEGEKLDNLNASLYRKNISKDFLPIEDNLICDGIWNKKKQLLIFNFDEKETLDPTTIFYLVLTIPEQVELLLKNGSFCLEQQCLPHQFHCCTQNKLSLVINTDSSHIKNQVSA